VAAVLLRREARHELCAHRRVRAVRTDEQVGVLAGAIGEPHRDVVIVLVVRAEPGGQADVVPSHGVGEQIRQLRPVHQQVLVVLRTELRGLEQPPGRVVEVHLAGLADGAHLFADAELVEHPQRVGPEPQPGAGGADLRRVLVDHDLDPGAAQRDPTGQAHDPGTDHHTSHHSPPLVVHPIASSCCPAPTLGTAAD
jgi:hypothetical protein